MGQPSERFPRDQFPIRICTSIVRVEERLEGEWRPFDRLAHKLLTQPTVDAVAAEGKRLLTVYKVTINEHWL